MAETYFCENDFTIDELRGMLSDAVDDVLTGDDDLAFSAFYVTIWSRALVVRSYARDAILDIAEEMADEEEAA
jgi:hypothetical protein